MGKRKAAQNCTILPWLSAKLDCKEGRFVQIGNSLLLTKKDEITHEEQNPFLRLSTGARLLYLCMCMESGGRKEFTFPLKAAKKYGFASTSFRRFVDELSNAGFVLRFSGANVRQPNKYSFGFDWKPPP